MERIRQLMGRVSFFWSSLKGWQKASLGGAALLVFVLLGLLAYWAGRPAYDPLFTGLEVDDEAAIVAYLKENKVPYRIDPAANAILLPRAQVYETRLALAQAGLPKGGSIGYELFDASKMGMSEFQQKITYIRALEGELYRTIKQLDAVDFVKVNIVIPEQKLFLEQQQPSTASVLLRLKSGRELGPEQVKAIVHLVSHSVQGLTPDNVTVVDSSGKVLSDLLNQDLFIYSKSGDGHTVSSVQRELERQQERELEGKVRMMLERVYGPGKVVVRVKVDLDFDKRSSTQKEFIPGPSGKGVIRSQQLTEENYKGPGTPPGGAPGTTTNIPGYAIANQGSGPSEYNKSDTVNNFEITTREQQENVTPGAIRRLSASVLVDGELPEPRAKELQTLVASAIGFREARGDQLVIQGMKFSTTLADTMAEQLAAQRRMELVFALVATVVALILSVLGALYYMRRKRMKATLAASGSKESKRIPTIQELLSSPDLFEAHGELAVLEEQLRAYARSKPEEIASLMQDWLAEEV